MNRMAQAGFRPQASPDAMAGPVFAEICESDFPIGRLPADGGFALAVITGIEGASYRPLGAAMLVDAAGNSQGSLSSGCLERDVVLRAREAIRADRPCNLRYGRGSPFIDIALPCGGGLDIRILPNPDRGLLTATAGRLAARQPARVVLRADGRLAGPQAEGMALLIQPCLRFLVLGKGAEAACFAALAARAGYAVEFYAPDAETRRSAGFGRPLSGTGWPAQARPDHRTAVTLFFHDHDLEPALLQAALASPAFYVGAQGSLRAHLARREALAARGVGQDDIERLASPFGLIASARDPRTLAVSVLADVLDRVQRRERGTDPVAGRGTNPGPDPEMVRGQGRR